MIFTCVLHRGALASQEHVSGAAQGTLFGHYVLKQLTWLWWLNLHVVPYDAGVIDLCFTCTREATGISWFSFFLYLICLSFESCLVSVYFSRDFFFSDVNAFSFFFSLFYGLAATVTFNFFSRVLCVIFSTSYPGSVCTYNYIQQRLSPAPARPFTRVLCSL